MLLTEHLLTATSKGGERQMNPANLTFFATKLLRTGLIVVDLFDSKIKIKIKIKMCVG